MENTVLLFYFACMIGFTMFCVGKSSGIKMCCRFLEDEYRIASQNFELAKQNLESDRRRYLEKHSQYRTLLKRYMARVMDVEGETFIENGMAYTFGAFNDEEREALLEIFHELRN